MTDGVLRFPSIVTPHSAGFSDGNEQRVARMFLGNLSRWVRNGL